jgi:hypothetical protein
MRVLGVLLLLFGIFTFVAYFAGFGAEAVAWIDTWGAGAGWGIRAGAVALGLLLIKMGGKDKKK